MTSYPQNWFWAVDGKSGYYSSSAQSYVSELPEDWFASVPDLIAAGASPMIAQTPDPVASEGMLFDLLRDVCTEGLPFDASAYAAQKRWEKEVGGTDWNGIPLPTDRESRNLLAAERLAVEAGERIDLDPWKFADGVFRPVTNAEMVEISNIVREHVRTCFAIESIILAAEPPMTREQIDAAFDA